LARDDGTYGPIPAAKPKGLLGMPFNTTVRWLAILYVHDLQICTEFSGPSFEEGGSLVLQSPDD
jgi:hypothetical protein